MSTLINREEAFWPLQERFDNLFNSFFGFDSLNAVKSNARSGYPKLDVVLNDNQYKVQAAVPGVKLDDLKVEILPDETDRKVLKISGKMENRYQSPTDSVFQVRELRRSHFERTLLLPENLVGDPDALLADGLLTLTWKTTIDNKPQPKIVAVKEKV